MQPRLSASIPSRTAASPHTGLTTGHSLFIEEARRSGDLYICQPYELYSAENHDTWRRLWSRMTPRWQKFANPHFLAGIESLNLDPLHVPFLAKVNERLKPLTGFQARPVSGYIPAFLFFDCLSRREFPTTITIRQANRLDYLPEPDIFHDVAGHVPMHTDPHFAEALVKFGECAHTAAARAASIAGSIKDETERLRVLSNVIKAMARFFWFTIEFGLMKSPRSPTGLRAYGSGLLSSYGELAHALESPQVQRHPMQLEWAINQTFEIDHYQPLLFTVESFEHLFELVNTLEQWMVGGRLDNVASGEPIVKDQDLASFLAAHNRA